MLPELLSAVDAQVQRIVEARRLVLRVVISMVKGGRGVGATLTDPDRNISAAGGDRMVFSGRQEITLSVAGKLKTGDGGKGRREQIDGRWATKKPKFRQ